MSPFGQQRRFAIAFWLAVAALAAFSVAELLSANRQSWFGLQPRNAAHNFSFNFTYYFPMTMLSSALAWVGFGFWRAGMSDLRAQGRKPRLSERLALLPAVIVFWWNVLVIIFIARTLLVSVGWLRP